MKKYLLGIIMLVAGMVNGQIIIKQSNKVNFYETIWVGTDGATPNDTANATMVVQQLGNVGIGTSSPTAKLDVVGNIKAEFIDDTIYHRITATSAADANISTTFTIEPTGFTILSADYTGNTYGQISASSLDNSVTLQGGPGNVGIGTYTPDQKLHVNGSVRIDSTLILNSEYETSTDSTFTVPVGISSVNSDKGSDWVSGTITMPANPVNGQIVSLSGQYATVTVAGQGGATISYQPGSAQIHHGVKYRYWASDNSWRPW
jgi:hypothetical protein